MRGALLALALLFSASAAAEAHAARIRPVSTSSPVAASAHAARIRPVSDSSPVAASTGWASEVERELMSPYCPGRSLVECPSPQATELRMWIHAQEQAGVPRAEVEARLYQEFGDTLRHAPRAEGWGLWAYLMPGLALVAGGALVVWFLGRSTSAAAPAPRPPPRDAELEREVDRELGAS